MPNIYMVETVGSQKVADMLDKTVEQQSSPPLQVLVQVNTSGEDQKSGEDVEGAVELCKHIRGNCSNLKLAGLMTIGSFDHDLAEGPNPTSSVSKLRGGRSARSCRCRRMNSNSVWECPTILSTQLKSAAPTSGSAQRSLVPEDQKKP